MSTKASVSASDVHAMLRAGVGRPEIIRQLIATGVWTRAGATEIVLFISRAVDASPKSPTRRRPVQGRRTHALTAGGGTEPPSQAPPAG